MSDPWDPSKGDRRISSPSVDKLEIEIRAEKMKVWLDGASLFLSKDDNKKVLIELMVNSLDQWAELRRKAILERLGFYAAMALLMSFLGYIGWKGWGGK